MADENKPVTESLATDKAPLARKAGTVLWVSLAMGVIAVGGGAGAMAAKMLSGAGPQTASASEDSAADLAPPSSEDKAYDYIDFEPITVNLNEPRLARYVRAGVTVAVQKAHTQAVQKQIDKMKPELNNWLTVYMAGCTLEDVRGPRNLNRIRGEIRDSFNEMLWPNKKPLINHVLLKEFAIQ